jgi:hypothetical protein
MARGQSGRIIAELDPELKGELYVELAREGRTFKEWLTEAAKVYVTSRQQPNLFPTTDHHSEKEL